MSRRFWCITSFLALIFLLSPMAGEGSISVKPAYIEVNIDKGRPSKTITVSNITDQETRYRLHIVHFVYLPDGNFKMVPPDEHSLAQWVKFNPREFVLGPNASRAIRLTIIPPGKLKPGEYWAALWFEPLRGQMKRIEHAEGGGMTLRVSTNILVPIIGQVPKIVYDCQLADLSASRTDSMVAISAKLTNTGTGRVKLKGAYEILDGSSTVVAEGLIGDDTILAGGERVFVQHVKGDFKGTEYSVRVRYMSEKLPGVLAGQTSARLQQ
jgi:hypothetical protein